MNTLANITPVRTPDTATSLTIFCPACGVSDLKVVARDLVEDGHYILTSGCGAVFDWRAVA